MLLAEHQGRWEKPRRLPSYQERCDELKLLVAPTDEGIPEELCQGMGAHDQDIVRVLKKLKIRYLETRRKTDRAAGRLLTRLAEGPIMAGMGSNTPAWTKWGHWIVLVRATDEHGEQACGATSTMHRLGAASQVAPAGWGQPGAAPVRVCPLRCVTTNEPLARLSRAKPPACTAR